ncbi:embryo defective 1273 isoform X2 [Wolffia australiana]
MLSLAAPPSVNRSIFPRTHRRFPVLRPTQASLLHPSIPLPERKALFFTDKSIYPSYPFTQFGRKPCHEQGLPTSRNEEIKIKPSKRTASTSHAMDMSAGGSGGQQRISIDAAIEALKELSAGLPAPVRRFPWQTASGNFVRLVVGLVGVVVKFLSVPVLLVSSLSEMSYCAHERKMMAIPVPFLFGFAVAKVVEETALEISPAFKEFGFPWHLVIMAAFFLLVKLPGPYYPYWGRLVLPHFANGGLSATLWSVFIWFRRSGHQVAE